MTLPPQSATGPVASADQTAWLGQARLACEESLARIEMLLATPGKQDRDMVVCLMAISRSLRWALTESESATEMSLTVRRALQVFDRIATMPDELEQTSGQDQMAYQ